MFDDVRVTSSPLAAAALADLPLQRASSLSAATSSPSVVPPEVIPGSEVAKRYQPTLPGLIGLLGGTGLKRGVTYLVESSTSLAMAMLAGPSEAGAWSAAIGLPSFGTHAAECLGIDLDRLALVPDPGEHWLDVVATLSDALDVLVVHPPGRPRDADVRRIAARMRQRGSTLIVLGSSWPGSELRLTVGRSTWLGLDRDGHGHLAARHAPVTASGRGRPYVERMWLPAPDGTVRPYEPSTALRVVR